MNIDKKIKKSIKYLQKYSKNNKFSSKETNNFIHIFLLYCQVKYNFNFNIDSNNLKIKPKIFDCCKFLYSTFKNEQIKNEIFEDNPILYDIFMIQNNNETKKILKKLINKLYSINYVNVNIEILDYLGNATNDIEIINCGYCLIWLKEINPDLKIPSKFIKILTKILQEVANKNKNNLRYSNSEAVLILFLLNKILYMENYQLWIEKFCSLQKNDGRWTNGYNSYFIDNTELYDSYHTVIGLILLLEYKTLLQYNNINENNINENNNINDDINNKTNKIYATLETLEEKIEKINNKIILINEIYMKYEFNRNLRLNLTTSYLIFQVEILKNERKYYDKIKTIFIKKFIKELYSISEFIILILISLDDLDIGYVEEKKNIMKKILKVKRQKYLNNGKIAELVNIILNNFRLTKIFLELFEKYILDNENENIRKNIHIKNFKVNLMNKKNHIEIEYNKNLDQLKELVNYFSDFADCINKQIKKQELFNYFMEHRK